MMKFNCLLPLGIFLAVSSTSVAKERDPAGLLLSKNRFVKICFGYDQLDEFHFQKKSDKVWIATWIDRDKANPDRKLRRALPSEIVTGELSELENTLLRVAPKMTSHLNVSCASKFSLEAGSALNDSRNKIKNFCLDRLNISENNQLGIWIASMMELF